MIRVLVKKLLDDKAFREKRRITLQEICAETGISRATLTRIVSSSGHNANLETIEALCKYFDCTPCDLLELVPEEEWGG